MEISRSSPQGNIFYIIGVFHQIRNQLKKEDINIEEYDKLLNSFMSMKYEEILKEIEKITDGVMTFVE